MLKKIPFFKFLFIFSWFPRTKHGFGRPQLHGWRTADFPRDLASGVLRVPPSPAVPCAPCHGSVAFHRRLFVSCPPPGCDNGRRCLACSSQASAAGPSPSAAGASLPLCARPIPKSFAIEWTELWDRLDAILLNIFSDVFNATAILWLFYIFRHVN